MGASDGTVIGITKILNGGPQTKRWNLVIVSEGYKACQMAQFATDAQSLVNRLLMEPPFNRPELARAINVFRLDVTSTESGADHPRCPGGTQTMAKTYFDSSFCFDGKTERLLCGDGLLVRKTVRKKLRKWHQILVLVNDSERGGSGGLSVAWASNGASDWPEMAIHELGHSAFELADEYDYGGPGKYPVAQLDEPDEPNVTIVANPTSVKWSMLVTAGTASPTHSNPNCPKYPATDLGPSPLLAATIGTFEGAKYSHCHAYRPVWTCMMRETTAPFCPVCVQVIEEFLSEFLKP